VDFEDAIVGLKMCVVLDLLQKCIYPWPMPNPWTGIGNPYTRTEVLERLHDTLSKGEAIIVAGAGTGISAKFIEKGGADLIIIYNSGRFRMMGHGATAGLMAYGDANAVAMEIERESRDSLSPR